jgi:flagellar hook-basal body complex protein FliE
MPEPYYEVLRYWEAKAKRTEITSALVTNVGQLASNVIQALLQFEAGQSLDSLRDNVKEYLGNKLALAQSLQSEAIEGTPTMIENEINNYYQVMIGALKAGIGQGVGAMHASLYGMLTGTDALIGGYQGLIQQVGINPVISRWVNAQVMPNIPDEETAWFMHKIGQLSDAEYKDYFNENGWNDSFADPLNWAWTHVPSIETLLNIRRRGMISDDDLKWLLKFMRFSDPVINNITALQVQYPEPYRLAEMYSKALVTNEAYLQMSAYFGLPNDLAIDWAEAQVAYPDFNTALALLRRGEIDNNLFYFWMQRNQITPDTAEVMLKLKDVIPPIQDLVRFAVREAFGTHNPDMQERAMITYAGRMGLSPEAAEWYWYAHWERIPFNYMLSNYYRGLWDKDKLLYMLKIHDIHPDDRADMVNVAYGPPSIRELGYGYDVGAYTVDDIVKYRRFGGLSPADAEKSGSAMVLYRTEAERNAIRSANMQLFKLGKITREEFEVALREITPQDLAVQLWLERGDLEYDIARKPAFDTEGRIVSSSEALTAFKLGLRLEDWTRAALKDLDWTQDRIDVAIEKAKYDMSQQQTTTTETKVRRLTVAEIRSFYNFHLITAGEMTVELTNLGYTSADAILLTEIYTSVPTAETQPKAFPSTIAADFYKLFMFDEEDLHINFVEQGYSDEQAGMLTIYTIMMQELPDLTALYQKGIITGADVVTELKKIGVSEYNAGLIVTKITQEYQIDRLTQEKNLTKAEIIKGVKNAVLTTVQGASLLMDLGYDENEAGYILAINAVVAKSDPEGYWEMRQVTERLKKAGGKPSMNIPDALITYEKQIKQLKSQINELKTKGGSETQIGELTLELNKAEQAMKALIIQSKLT